MNLQPRPMWTNTAAPLVLPPNGSSMSMAHGAQWDRFSRHAILQGQLHSELLRRQDIDLSTRTEASTAQTSDRPSWRTSRAAARQRRGYDNERTLGRSKTEGPVSLRRSPSVIGAGEALSIREALGDDAALSSEAVLKAQNEPRLTDVAEDKPIARRLKSASGSANQMSPGWRPGSNDMQRFSLPPLLYTSLVCKHPAHCARIVVAAHRGPFWN